MLILIASTAIGLPQISQPQETPGDAYVAPERIILGPSHPPSTAGVTHIQVNTLDGLNILNDAANEPSIVIDQTAPLRMAVGWRQFDTLESDFRQAGTAWTVDGGRTWSDGAVIQPGVARSDPFLRGTRDGTMYYISLRYIGIFATDLFVSFDGGQSWPVVHEADGGDHPSLAIDQTGGIGDGNLYQRTQANHRFTRSFDAGMTWLNVFDHIGGSIATLDVGPDGTVYDAGGAGGTMAVARSLDVQDARVLEPSFSMVFVEDDPQGRFVIKGGQAPNPIGINGQPDIGTDHSGGPLHGSVYAVATWMPDVDVERYEIGVVRSDDGGLTWLPPQIASDPVPVGVHRWFGTMSIAPNGRVDVVFNDNRDAPNGEPNLTRTYYTFSTDGGVTWSADLPIGPIWDSHLGFAGNNKKLGDYYDMHSDLLGVDLIYAATYNDEQDVYHARIGPSDCNANGVDDDDDIADATSGDCNNNAIPDECEIAAGTLTDDDADGIPDQCACPADVNADGELNILDFVSFQLAWQAGDPEADCDASGTFDLLDFVCFQALFQEGCK